jgi:hypothetical protein
MDDNAFLPATIAEFVVPENHRPSLSCQPLPTLDKIHRFVERGCCWQGRSGPAGLLLCGWRIRTAPSICRGHVLQTAGDAGESLDELPSQPKRECRYADIDQEKENRKAKVNQLLPSHLSSFRAPIVNRVGRSQIWENPNEQQDAGGAEFNAAHNRFRPLRRPTELTLFPISGREVVLVLPPG